jgi:hypothetical protein
VPLDRSRRLTDQSVVMNKAEDIGLVFDALRRVRERTFFTRERAQRDVAEEIGYQLLIHPDWILPHVPELVRNGVTAAMHFAWQCLLMSGAPSEIVGSLIQSLGSAQPQVARRARLALLASRVPVALEAVAAMASEDESVASECRDLGFHLQTAGSLVPRFTVERRGLRLRPDTTAHDAPHAVGLPLDAVVAHGEDRISFSYLSVTPATFAALPRWEGRAHLVSPRLWPFWTLVASAGTDSRLRVIGIEDEWVVGDYTTRDSEVGKLDKAASAAHVSAAVELAMFDDLLTYANQHPLRTPSLIGVLGGPPPGPYPLGLAYATPPLCPTCGRVMFHVGWTTYTCGYGDGVRLLFLCEDCRTSATVATN